MNTAAKYLKPRFVEFIPKALEEGIIYVSCEYATMAHKCACGCAEKVILPLHPTDWKLKFDGISVTIRPSIGNWSFPCRSHYLITENRIEWAGVWKDEQITAGRSQDALRKINWHDHKSSTPTQISQTTKPVCNRLTQLLQSISKFLRR